MSADRITLDTNILVYAFDSEAETKHSLAVKTFERAIASDCILTLQALSEFFTTITRKKGVSTKKASEIVHDLQALFTVVCAKESTLKRAINVVCNNKMSFWDAMLWATAQDAGVTLLLSEDFQHEHLLDGVRIVNPFLPNDYWSVG